ncbi:hypothetical protein Thiowin_04352 [Thiorhodovibrio winogradskyi]|uniref:PPM-type phosphatase domain-containing protein n=1 Tax=Thiorhodovibrio winogradskyi TaxID=77007 RepID=A0ABZ0SI61_9GAMM|nr:protein phosphatase 2C domain-containing protein [Thiorhodovibrio winogradskyi]
MPVQNKQPLALAMVQHRGLGPRQQQDALLAGGLVWQALDLLPRAESIASDGGICAVADGVAASFKPQLASRVLRDMTMDPADEDQASALDQLQDGWTGPRALRRSIHPRLCRHLSPRTSLNPSATTLALLQWRDGHFSALNVGESRIYCITAEGEWRQLSLLRQSLSYTHVIIFSHESLRHECNPFRAYRALAGAV